jgi:undecaprenyl-diphosphatase
MSRFLDASGPFAPLLVFLLAAGESAAFLGLFVPGEVAVILGGVAAGAGSVSLWVMIPAAVLGAIAGDSIGYRLGSKLGPTLLERKRMAKLARHMDRAAAMLSERGWWALVIARFASVLRAVVPFAAGMGKMAYRRFLLGNTIGGIAWGTTFTLVGYLAGTNYPRVERWFRTGGLAVAGVALIVGAIVWLTRWAQRNQDVVLSRIRRLTDTGPIRALTGLLRRPQLGGLALTVTAAAIIGGTWLFAGLAQDVLGTEEFFFFDLGTVSYLAEHPIGQLTAVARVINTATDARFLLALAAIAVIATLFRGHRRRAVALIASIAGQWAIVEITSSLVDRAPPAVAALAPRVDYGFPSEHVALVTAFAIAAAWGWRRTDWRSTIGRYGIVALVIAATGISRVVLLVEYPSDTIAAAAIATAWTLIVNLAITPVAGERSDLRPGFAPANRISPASGSSSTAIIEVMVLPAPLDRATHTSHSARRSTPGL